MTAACRVLVATVATVLVVASPARAQTRVESVEPQIRVDGFLSHFSSLQAALGVDIPISPAMHLELAAGAGPSFAAHAVNGANVSARGDAIVHFLIDPQHRMRWSPYAGGGIGARYDRAPGDDWRAVAIIVAGVNAPTWKHAVPFIEAGLGGGFRIGAGLRRGR